MNEHPEDFVERAAEAYDKELGDKPYSSYAQEQLSLPVLPQEHINKNIKESEMIIDSSLVQSKVEKLREQSLEQSENTTKLKNN